MFEEQIHKVVKKRSIVWQKHALQRMLERNIYRNDVIAVLTSGELIEFYKDDNPLPSGLFLGYSDHKPLHVVAALDQDYERCFVITAYHPDSSHFESDFKTRKK